MSKIQSPNQTLTFVIYTDDNSSIFLNDALLATPSSCQNTSLSFSLVKGWNKIEIIWYEGGGGDGFHVNYNGSRLHNSFLIDCFAIDSNNYVTSASNADTLDGIHASSLVLSYHNYSSNPNIDSFTDSAYILTVADNGNYGGGTKPSGSHNGLGIINMHTHVGNYYS